jgi:hypothetical protein
MKVLRHRAAVLSTVGSCLLWCTALPASADLVVFDLAWSGASFGNDATATGRITIDDALLANPGNNSSTTPGLVTALVVTISGASTGNGTYGLADFTRIELKTGSLTLDFTRELVGQPTDQDPWGTSQPGNTGGDFNLFGASPAPNGTHFFKLQTNGGAGDDLLLTSLRPLEVEPTIDPVDRYAWGENIGWTDWRWDPGTPGKGATIGQYFCAGFIWGENVGWIQLGTGAPADDLHYTNTAAADYGLNHDGKGNLFGLAWGENIGWITFDQSVSNPPHLDLATGRFAGYAYGENIGWIDLGSNGIHFVKTTTIEGGPDLDLDLIADAWELEQAKAAGLGPVLTHLDKTTDTDGDGKSDLAEYLADSDPFDFADYPRIVTVGRDEMTSEIILEWTSSPRRIYEIGSTTALDGFTVDFDNLAPDAGVTTSVMFSDPQLSRKFWQVGAKLPLAPPAP